MSEVRQFICGHCREPIESDATDQEVLDEMRAAFGDLPPEHRVIVCDECYRRFKVAFDAARHRGRLASDSGIS